MAEMKEVKALWELYLALRDASDTMERYIWFSDNGKPGCKFTQKSRDLFYSAHYDKIMELIDKLRSSNE
jgi:hypothetical protein